EPEGLQGLGKVSKRGILLLQRRELERTESRPVVRREAASTFPMASKIAERDTAAPAIHDAVVFLRLHLGRFFLGHIPRGMPTARMDQEKTTRRRRCFYVALEPSFAQHERRMTRFVADRRHRFVCVPGPVEAESRKRRRH